MFSRGIPIESRECEVVKLVHYTKTCIIRQDSVKCDAFVFHNQSADVTWINKGA